LRRVSILIADDHPVVRRGLKALLETRPGWRVVAEAKSGREALQKAKDVRPDVAILDISMPGLNGLDTTALIRQSSPKTRVLILTMHAGEELVERAVQAGASGYVLKSDAEDDLISAVSSLLSNRAFFTSKAALVLLRKIHPGKKKTTTRRNGGDLTVREREVEQLLAEGLSNKEVAAQLKVSVRTVENHRANIMRKLELTSFSEMVRHAIRNKIVEP
jgi:DNA-binding NarL/FixJ family response regulator